MSSKKKKPEKYVCTLSPELLKKAKEELNEDPKRRDQDIQELRDHIEKEPGLDARTDSQFLIRFLRARKFDIDRAFQMFIKFYQMRQENPDIFADLQPSCIKPVLEDEVTCVLDDRDEHGRRIFSLRPGNWNPEKYDLKEVFRSNIITLMKLIQTKLNKTGLNNSLEKCPNEEKDEETQVNGIVFLIDLQSLTLSHVYHFTPGFAKKMTSLLQESFPMRLKAIHYIHEPAIFKYVFPIIRPFLKQKTLDRLHFHAYDYKSLYEFVKQDILPQDYEGKKPPLSNKDWREYLYSCEDEYIEEQKYGYRTLVAEYNPNAQDAMGTLAGSFKKLET